MRFNPLSTATITRDVLRRLFREFAPDDLKWDPDEKKSKIVIGTANDYHSRDGVQQFPRILVQRGMVTQRMTSISENLREVVGEKSEKQRIKRQDIDGSIQIIVEATNEGTCEVIGDFVRILISWSKPYLELDFGFQAYAREMQLSECMPDREDKEKFKIVVTIPYRVEDGWMTESDAFRLKNIFLDLKSS